jgi:hypothetical protein
MEPLLIGESSRHRPSLTDLVAFMEGLMQPQQLRAPTSPTSSAPANVRPPRRLGAHPTRRITV